MSLPAFRIVLITGANSGVGYATSKVLATATTTPSFHVIMTGRSFEKVQKAKAELEQEISATATGTLTALQLDVTDAKSVEDVAKYVKENHGHLDALINNAANGSRDSDLVTRLRLCFDTNVIGAALVAQTFRPLLLKSSNPYSIWVSSGAGSIKLSSEPGRDPANLDNDEAYRASKAALNMVMQCEHRDWHKKGLKTLALSPGFVVSNLRGTSEEMRNPGGKAGDPIVAGQTILGVLEGKRDDDAGKLVHKRGVYPW
ncbi:hypothetical protein H2198_005007 [Neophaeococcomyces mojaviensis]|uniref:Uncharacterized protein n=1 Tax=Neophaeococcomyces mojaviensis TaxID=3383035 RepID=A0ACC3A7M9_9EURO|nr:hypothetical protein H2198_005007 [Knufia sp. JES_112]